MTSTVPFFDDYTTVCGEHFNSNSCTTDNIDYHQKPWYLNGNFAEDCPFFSSSSGSPMSDEYFSCSDLMSEKAPLEQELQRDRYSRPIQHDFDKNLSYYPDAVSYLATPTSTKSFLGVVNRRAVIPESFHDHCVSERSIEVLPVDYGRFMWSPPPSPTFQATPTQVDAFSDLQIVIPTPTNMRPTSGRQDGFLVEKTFNEQRDGSFLFVRTNNVEQLQVILRERGLQVQDIGKTRTPGIIVVLFKRHEFAKRAFITQRQIKMRMVPPGCTKQNWLKNPSPKFHVIFETTRRLTVKTGKSSCNMKIGDYLMTNARNGRGCLVLADQLKGHRMRVVSYIGRFVRKDGIIMESKSFSENRLVGWISTKCCKTKKKFVLRRSMNEIDDYVYNDEMQAVKGFLTDGNIR